MPLRQQVLPMLGKNGRGEIKGLDRFSTADSKRVLENNFNNWAKVMENRIYRFNGSLQGVI